MALANGLHWTLQDTATTGNTGGAGFNIANANFVTDLTTNAGTANTTAPILSSATYTFLAGDVGAWVYVASGTNWIPGWYKISSVTTGKATVNGTVAAAVTFNSVSGEAQPSTVVGCATTGTPTAGTFGIDYSQQDTAQATATDYASVGASTTLTSASAGFTRMMVGNFFHQTTTGTGAFGIVGWYEIVSYTSATSVSLDRTPNSGTASVACTGFCGGAGRLNGLEDAFLEQVTAGNFVWLKNGSYTLSAAINIASTNSTTASPTNIIGFNTVRGDVCTGANRPLINSTTLQCAFGQSMNLRNLSVTGSAATCLNTGAGAIAINCKVIQTSSLVRTGIALSTDGNILECEIVSINGGAVSLGSRSKVYGCYVHDSATGIVSSQTGNIISGCVVEGNATGISLTSTSGSSIIVNNTIYGRESKSGVGISLNANPSPNHLIANNVIYGLDTGISTLTTEQKSNMIYYNDFFNNTADVTLTTKMANNLAVDPQFNGASQISGSTATTSGSVLTQSGGDFSPVTDGADYLHVISGTGVTAGNYQITSHTSTTLTVNNALGTSSGGDVVYYVATGHDFSIGTNLRAAGRPSLINGSESTSYLDMGAVQRQEPSTSATYIYSVME